MLKISSVSKTYDSGVKALDNLNLTVSNGLFGLLGPNGAGKSSLMRTLATLQGVDSGSITFNNIDVLTDPQAIRATLGYLPQEFSVYPRISAFDLLEHIAVLKGFNLKAERHEMVDSLLAHTNLFQHKKKSVSGFSGGMRQRFGIAQALIGNPELIIVDEPTAGLDPEERNRFNDLLVSLGEEKVVILSTHIVDDVTELCSNMAVLAGGKVLLEGNPLHLIDRITNQVWKKTVGKEDLEELEGTLAVISKRLSAGKIIVHVFAKEAPAGFELASAELNDVYFSSLYQHRQASVQ